MAIRLTRGRLRKRWILAVLSASLFMGGMDMTIVNVALPAIIGHFSATAAQAVWIVNSYTLTVAALLILMGITGDRLGRRRVLLGGLVLFATGSATAGLSVSPLVMIGGRCIQGVGAAAVMAASVTLLRVVFTDRRERSVAIGVWTASASLGAALGPVVGGLLVENFSWSSVFFVNVVLAAVVLLGAAIVIPESRSSTERRIDSLSVILCVLGIGGISYFLQTTADARAVDLIPGLAGALSITAIAAFVIRQQRLSQPLLRLVLFRHDGFAVSTVVVMVSWGSYAGLIFILTQQLQLARDYTPLQAGLALVPLALANSVGAAIAPHVEMRIGRRALLVAAFMLAALSFASIAVLGPLFGSWAGIGVGVSIGIIITVGTDAMLGSAPVELASDAGAIQETAFSLGSGFGVGIMGAVLAVGYQVRLELPSGLSPTLADQLRGSFQRARGIEVADHDVLHRIHDAAAIAYGEAYTLTAGVVAGILLGLAAVCGYAFRRRSEPDDAARSS